MKKLIAFMLLLLSSTAFAGFPPISSTNDFITILPGQKIQCNTAASSQNGCLTSSDWSGFNSASTATTNATNLATSNTIVKRDGSAGFLAGVTKLGPTQSIELGTLDAYSRTQIWNHEPNSNGEGPIIRIGSWASDGDATSLASGGMVIYGDSLLGTPIDIANGSYARIKNNRFGLFDIDSTLPAYSGGAYYFRVDDSAMFYADNSGNQTFNVNRVSGQVTTTGGTQLSTSATQPTCNATNRGLQWVIQGTTGVADIYQVCQKNSSNVYQWVSEQGALSFSAPLVNTANTITVSTFTGDTGSGGTTGIVPAPSANQSEAGAYLSAGGTFTSPDQSKPRNDSFKMISQIPAPVPTGATIPTTLTRYQNVFINGNHAYVIGGAGVTSGYTPLTLSIFNIANQAAPLAEGYITTGSVHWTSGDSFLNGGYNLAIGNDTNSNGFIFVCSSGSSWVYAVNVSNPNNPYNVSGILVPGTPGSIYGCAYQNGYIYAATQSQGLDVIDFGGGGCGGTITAPVNCYQQGGGVKSFGVQVSGTNLFTTQYSTSSPFTTRQIISWTLTGAGTPIAPSLVQSLQVTTAGEALALSIYGNTAYVTVSATGVNAYDLIDITTLSAMTNLSVITPSYSVNSGMMAVQKGNYVYVPSGSNATNGGAIDLFDITNRSAPLKVATAYTGVASSVFGGIALDNKGYIYAADYGPAPGNLGTLSVFTEANFVSTVTTQLVENLNIKSTLQIPVQSLGVSPLNPVTGSLGLTSTFIMCVYNGSSWVHVSDGSTSCTF